jgi:preprotein translocase subunit YajC
MKRLLFGSMLAVAIVGAGGMTPMLASAQTSSTDNLVQGGLTLPRSHQYQAYDSAAARYENVRVESVPDRVSKKQMVYDRTAKLWVYHPSVGGLNPMYSATAEAPPSGAREWQRVHGKVQSVSGNTVTVKTDDGRTLSVDASRVSNEIRGALTPDEGVTLIGFAGSDATKFRARYIQQDSSDPSRGGTAVGQTPTPAAADGKSWQRVHGKVQSVSGTTVTVKADDGRTLTVDAAQVSAEIRGALKPDAGVTLVGFAGDQPTRFTARYIEQDSSAGAAPSALPGPVDEKSWQRIHGTVRAVSGTTLSMKADDGRDLKVDMKEVGEAIRQSLTSGDKVLVIGFYRGDQNTVAARYVEKAPK